MPTRRSPGERREASAERRARRAAVDDPAVVMEAAAAFLAARQRSVAETRRRLRHLGYPSGLVDEVVGRLVEMGYLDDEAFARAWIASRDRARPRGAIALRQELGRKGIAGDVIEAALEERETSTADADADGLGADVEAARRLIERRRGALEREADPRKRRQRAYALLARNGFDPEVCRSVASEASVDATG